MQYRYVAPLSPSGSSPDGGAKNVMPLNLIALPMRGRLKRSDASRRFFIKGLCPKIVFKSLITIHARFLNPLNLLNLLNPQNPQNLLRP